MVGICLRKLVAETCVMLIDVIFSRYEFEFKLTEFPKLLYRRFVVIDLSESIRSLYHPTESRFET